MITTLPVNQLKVGMYVIMPVGWMHHPFLRNQFLIASEEDIAEIVKSGVDAVRMDSSRSRAAQDFQSITHPAPEPMNDSPAEPSAMEAPANWHPEKMMTEELRASIHDDTLSPRHKSEAVYRQSLQLMNNVFENPTAGVIKEAKETIGQVADLILHDEETSRNLLRLTSHDFYTYTHSVNVGILGIFLAKRLYGGDSGHDLSELGAGFFLHDLGKLRVDQEILNKPARLTEMEMKHMRIHPYQSYKILKETGNLTEACRTICMQHHEREDGKGYPRGLRGDEIHDYARVCSIADVFDALTAERSYKRSLSPYEALVVMKEEMLGFFQKEIFENFVLLFQ